MGFKAMGLSPFKAPPLDNLHISPMMTREKHNASHRRVIIDFSFPEGLSVNAGVVKDNYLGTLFTLRLPTIDNIINQVKVLSRGCKLYKVHIIRAFRPINLDPMEYDLLGLHHDAYYVDTCLPFGYHNGSVLFQRISNAVHHIMCQRQHDIINYINDILGIDFLSRIDASLKPCVTCLPSLVFNFLRKKFTCLP